MKERIEDHRHAIARPELRWTATVLAVGLAVLGCVPGPDAVEPAPPTPEVQDALNRARQAADELGLHLMAELGGQLQTGSPAAAIEVCSEIAPRIADEISRDGLRIRRTSLKLRNLENAPDDWERSGLEGYVEVVAGGATPSEVYEIGEGGDELRYLRPILVADLCLACHGAAEALEPEVHRRLAERYPDDRATGYSAGDLRGAFSVRVRLPEPPVS